MQGLLLAVLLQFTTSQSFPTTSRTSWMEPDSFHLCIGMTRKAAEETIQRFGWEMTPGKYPRVLVIKYDDTKTVTIQFVDEKLQSIRFEYVGFVPDVRIASEERRAQLERSLGYNGKKQGPDGNILMFDRAPAVHIMVVTSTRPDDSFGRQGLGFLAVRYFDPSAELVP